MLTSEEVYAHAALSNLCCSLASRSADHTGDTAVTLLLGPTMLLWYEGHHSVRTLATTVASVAYPERVLRVLKHPPLL